MARRKKWILALTAIAEAATGAALLIVPSPVGRWLLGAELTGVAIPIAGVTGIALIALGVACWPGSGVCGMLTYSVAVTIYFVFLGVRGEWVGPLLWPAVLLHSLLSLLLAWRLFRVGDE